MTLRIFLQAFLSISLFLQSDLCEANQKIVWGPSKSAVSYEYVISKTKNFDTILTKGEVTTNDFGPTDLPEGDYFLKVRFKDKWGRFSPYSKVSRIEIKAEKVEPVSLPEETEKAPGPFSLSYLPTPMWTITYNGFKISESTLQNISLNHDSTLSDYSVQTSLGALGSSQGRGWLYQAHIQLQNKRQDQLLSFGWRADLVHTDLQFKDDSRLVNLSGVIAYLGPVVNFNAPYINFSSHIGIEKDAQTYVFAELMSPPLKNKILTTQLGVRYNRIQTRNFEGSISSETISFVFDFLGGK